MAALEAPRRPRASSRPSPCPTTGATTARSSTPSRPSTASRSTSSTRYAGSGDEIEAIKANKDNPGDQAPDVIDVGLAFGPTSKAEGLLAPYKVATWDTIPDEAKDADGAWYGDYYGVLSFEVNTAVVANVPQDWSDLLKPEYKGQVALAGDPRTSSQAIQAVYAAALANGGSLDDAATGSRVLQAAERRRQLRADHRDVGARSPPVTPRSRSAGPTTRSRTATPRPPAVARRSRSSSRQSGRFAGVYVQGISAYAPHPNAAKLWEEFLYSDEGQNIWLKGYCHPIRYADLVANNAVPAEQLAKLPDVDRCRLPDPRAARRGRRR